MVIDYDICMILLIIMGCDSSYLGMCATCVSLFSVCSFFSCLCSVFFFSTHSSQGQLSVLKQVSVSNTVFPQENVSDPNTPPDIHSGHVALELAPPPQRLSDAEVPIWKELEGRSGKDKGQNSTNEGAKPLFGG